MIDHRFFGQAQALSVAAIADLTKAKLERGHQDSMVDALALPHRAESGTLCFALSKQAAESVVNKKDVVCLVLAKYAPHLGDKVTVLIAKDPKQAFAEVMKAMHPEPEIEGGISNDAYVADDVVMGEGVKIDAGAIVHRGVELGAGVWIKSGACIDKGCVIGAGTIIDYNAVVAYARIGSHCHIGFGATIGFCGFGIGKTAKGNRMAPHLGRVIIEDDCCIGAKTAIDRGFIDDTIIGRNTMIDNHVQIGHNTQMGEGNILCGRVGVAGSVQIGDNNLFAGATGVSDHVSIGSGNTFAGETKIFRDIGDNMVMGGFPAVPIKEFHEQTAYLRRLTLGRKSTKNKRS